MGWPCIKIQKKALNATPEQLLYDLNSLSQLSPESLLIILLLDHSSKLVISRLSTLLIVKRFNFNNMLGRNRCMGRGDVRVSYEVYYKSHPKGDYCSTSTLEDPFLIPILGDILSSVSLSVTVYECRYYGIMLLVYSQNVELLFLLDLEPDLVLIFDYSSFCDLLNISIHILIAIFFLVSKILMHNFHLSQGLHLMCNKGAIVK
ncbi:MAG: hypothetical protein EZS28_010622 [Streblomastix strix]|uniref:Uncharacterized protein n=1 Tax=Streblomastix strix TaxID=222440 RepID=A0A5J4WG13_9EUKA|nr:MAG: hypothetical protein EZS28_010622 [Streblomastix strix]